MLTLGELTPLRPLKLLSLNSLICHSLEGTDNLQLLAG